MAIVTGKAVHGPVTAMSSQWMYSSHLRSFAFSKWLAENNVLEANTTPCTMSNVHPEDTLNREDMKELFLFEEVNF